MSTLSLKITRCIAVLIALCALTVYAGLANAQGGLQFDCEQYTATLSQHESASRAYSKSVVSWWTTTKTWYAVGSDETLGTVATKSVILHESSQGVFQSGNCPAPDATAPVLTLIGDQATEVSQFSEFVDLGATAIDDRDGDITSQVTVSGDVDTKVIGTYELTYSVTDAAGNQAAPVVRTIVVTKALTCQEYTSTVTLHEQAGRAYSKSVTSWWTQTKTWYAQGSNNNLGTAGTATKTLRETPVGSGAFELGECPAIPVPPAIDFVNVSNVGSTVTFSGSASDVNGDLEEVYLFISGAGFPCHVSSPIGSIEGVVSYNCSDMSNWSFEVYNLPDGVYDCEASNGCAGVRVADSEMQYSEVEWLSFVVGDLPSVAPTIDSINVSVDGYEVTVTGSASDANDDLQSIVLYTSGGGFACDIDSPIGAYGIISYDCTDMTNWSFVISGFNAGVHDCQGSNGCVAVTAVDSEMQSSEMEFLSFTVYDVQPQLPVITSVETSVVGTTLTVTGSAVAGDNDLKGIVLYFPGGGMACDAESPIGTVSNFSYDCSDMSNWSFVVTDMDVGVYDCQGSNSCMAVKVTDTEMQDSELEFLSFTVTGEVIPECFTAINTAHAQAQRAVLMYNVLYYSVGANDYLGLGTDSTSLTLNEAGVWKKVNSCPN